MSSLPPAATPPADPVAAVTHHDPYPYYASLVADRPLYRDEKLGLWVASSAAAVTAVLTSEICRVRPPAEPVPKALVGSPTGEIFGRLVRMNDGAGHSPLKQAVSATLASAHRARVAEVSQAQARILAEELALADEPSRISDFAFRLPVHVVATLLGVPAERLSEVARWTGDFVRCLSPLSSPEQIEQSKAAAARLLDLFGSLMAAPPSGDLFGNLTREGRARGSGDTAVLVANGIGFLSQSYEATAGLIDNTLLALISQPKLGEGAAGNPALVEGIVQEVLRFDPPVQNTRRFLAESGEVFGQKMKEDEAVLVVLAAANRDPAANPDPARFEPLRSARRIFSFGAGGHVCPGDALASLIAEAGVREVLSSGARLERLAVRPSYRPSGNTRVPVWASPFR